MNSSRCFCLDLPRELWRSHLRAVRSLSDGGRKTLRTPGGSPYVSSGAGWVLWGAFDVSSSASSGLSDRISATLRPALQDIKDALSSRRDGALHWHVLAYGSFHLGSATSTQAEVYGIQQALFVFSQLLVHGHILFTRKGFVLNSPFGAL